MNLAYVAGLFDGEGCVNFTRCRSSIYPRIFITNTNKELLEELKDAFGGDINPLALRKKGWKQGWQWRLSWSNAVDFLDKLTPYLRLKLLQAQTVFAWDAIRPGRGGRWDRESIQLLLDRMTWLNCKGDRQGIDPIERVLS